MSVVSPLLTVMIAAARKAGKAISRDFGEVENLQLAKKGPSDFVTAADLKTEKILFEELSKARPGYGFLGEERGMVEGTDKTNRWIVDPIDGTTNFVHAIPHLAISIALEREGRLVAGVVYNPITDDLYWAETGRGAFHNDKRLRVAARKTLGDHRAALPLRATTCLKPKAPALRKMEPTLPASCTRSRTTEAASVCTAWAAGKAITKPMGAGDSKPLNSDHRTSAITSVLPAAADHWAGACGQKDSEKTAA